MNTIDVLVENLLYRDVYFLRGHKPTSGGTIVPDADLICLLTKEEDARLRLALIPLFLRHPSLNIMVPQVVQTLPPFAATHLKLYYSAAAVLQTYFYETLFSLLGDFSLLPSLYEEELGHTGVAAKQKLEIIGKHHVDLTGMRLNWVGTYMHGATRFIQQLRTRQPIFYL